MSNLEVSIYDFDQTLSFAHTYHEFGCYAFSPSGGEPTPESKAKSFADGKEEATINCKRGVKERLKHDDQHLTAIATYHNNPEFVAGFISSVLGEELTFFKTVYSDGSPKTAVDYYSVPGEKKPILISYIPHYGRDFDNALKKLHGKNEQILHLRKLLLAEQCITENQRVNFYDDSQNNYNNASALPFVNRYLVDHPNIEFRVAKKDSKPELDKEIPASFLMDILSSPMTKDVCSVVALASLTLLTGGLLGLIALTITQSLIAASVGAVSGLMTLGFWSCTPTKPKVEEYQIPADYQTNAV